MKNKLFSFGIRTRSGERFEPGEIVESTAELTNPACGLYSMYTLPVECAPDLDNLRWCARFPLIQVFFQIGHYRKKPFDEEAFSHMEEVLSKLHASGNDIILRFAYDNTGKGLEHEPETFGQILEHMESLHALLGKYAEDIYLMQGLFVGSWGEMHSSRYLGTDRLMQLEQRMREVLGKQPYLAFRRPMQYRRLHEKVSKRARTGLFDDGILGSDDNLGTFGAQPKEKAGWTNPWSREDEIPFFAELARTAPIGGEAVLGNHQKYPYSLDETLSLLGGMNISYLNSGYDLRVHEAWKRLEYTKKGPWLGMNGKEYIYRHLGYRFRVTGVAHHVKQGICNLTISVQNDGFSRAYQEMEAYVVCEGVHVIPESDLSRLQPGKEMILRVELPFAPGQVTFGVRRKKDKREIMLANEYLAKGRVRLGEMVR